MLALGPRHKEPAASRGPTWCHPGLGLRLLAPVVSSSLSGSPDSSCMGRSPKCRPEPPTPFICTVFQEKGEMNIFTTFSVFFLCPKLYSINACVWEEISSGSSVDP